jgi:hypothetical protein
MYFHVVYKVGDTWIRVEEYLTKDEALEACDWYEAIGFTVRIDPA